MSQGLRTFFDSVVRPCLSVHPGTMSDRVPDFVGKFLRNMGRPCLSEMEKINLDLAISCCSGRLESNPFIQGLLVKCVRNLEREDRGLKQNVGRYGKSEEETWPSFFRFPHKKLQYHSVD